jgi:hypothetical protein
MPSEANISACTAIPGSTYCRYACVLPATALPNRNTNTSTSTIGNMITSSS